MKTADIVPRALKPRDLQVPIGAQLRTAEMQAGLAEAVVG